MALEEVPVVVPATRAAPRPDPARVRPAEPPPPPEPAPGPAAEPAAVGPDLEHDPHTPHAAGLPVSVLIGLSLLPFGIPLAWVVAPFLTGFEPALSLAVPVALAVSASALSLGVVYTIDWRAATRVKGVLMLVGLAYLTGAGLFFLKQQLLERLQRYFHAGPVWVEFPLTGGPGRFATVRVPDKVLGENPPGRPLPLPGTAHVGCARVLHRTAANEPYEYTIGWASAPAGAPFDADWWDRVGAHLSREHNAPRPVAPRAVRPADERLTCREWTFPHGPDTAFVRVYVAGSRAFYLAVQGPNPNPENEFVEPFFRSFKLAP